MTLGTAHRCGARVAQNRPLDQFGGYEVIEVAWACVLAGLIVGLYSDSPTVDLWLALGVLAAISLLPKIKLKMHAVDWSMLVILGLEMPSVFFSQYRANSIRTSWAVMIAVLVFYAIRLTIRTPIQIAFLSGLLGLGGAWLGLSGFRQFTENARLFAEANLTNLVAFRARLMSPPGPWIPGEWFTLLLLGLPFAYALPACLWQRNRKWLAAITMVAPVLIAATLCLSLSRAAFGSIVVFCLVMCVLMVGSRLVTLRTAGMLLGSIIGGLVLILVCESAFYPGIFKVYAGQHTTQVRSTEGRLAIWHRSFEVVRSHPLLGVGSSNAALALTSTTDQEETTGFASRTFSLPLQILVEKGIIGFLLYATFLVLLAREFILAMRPPAGLPTGAAAHSPKVGSNGSHGGLELAVLTDQSAHKAMACCFAAGLVAVLFRELVYSSLLEHTLTLVLAAVLSALMCLPERGT